MRMYDLIEKKKLGKALTQQEIDWMVQGQIPNREGFKLGIARLDAIDLVVVHIGQASS
mgnify:CR=1 FL=1